MFFGMGKGGKVYNPAKYKSEDLDEAFEMMDRHPFATLISVVSNRPYISHLPLTVKKSTLGFELIGHMARANIHWNHIECSRVTAIFQGPHAYITPRWYAENDVPTWNYSTIHANELEFSGDFKQEKATAALTFLGIC